MEELEFCDIEVLRSIQAYRLEALDDFFYWVSYSTTYVSLSIILYMGIYGFVKKNHILKLKFYTIVSMFISSAIITFILKNIISRPRPFITHPDIIKLTEGGSLSFPSGHTCEAFTMALGIMTLCPKSWAQYPLLFWAILVAYSRISLGVHYPSDILASITLAALIMVIVRKILASIILSRA